MNIEREYINELIDEYLKTVSKEDLERDYFQWYMAWVRESLYYIARWENWSLSDIKRSFNSIF